ncbi:hypothetical protein B0H16DRAFT_1763121 [Mycena metata]|uniref:DUF7788 domain-containing protein n=1 Tax=Mycena metata TaxID=1033252 RepID=A0AAD7I9K3_9AGAR|nr:hypothetical protein B0H16DRAFT_1763121 [Mycena metata]
MHTRTTYLEKHPEEVAAINVRVAEAQWKELVQNLRDAGTLENSIAICDVSGSMGRIAGPHDPKNPSPILPAVSRSLLLAQLARARHSTAASSHSQRGPRSSHSTPQSRLVPSAGDPFDDAASHGTASETNHEAIERRFKEAEYQMAQIVYWNLSRYHDTLDVQADRKSVALMKGFSPALLKVFMGEEEEMVEAGNEGMISGSETKVKAEFDPDDRTR